ncbi:MAG TPA: fumarylacetoacetate hydrolase family protein [Burkholderiales bacterium]|nr:fumarylacetoacetate hydrolase family protein [Burkholderiales bacterium]
MADDTDLRAALAIRDYRLARRRLPGLDPSLRPADEAAAYRIQNELHRLLTGAGLGPVAGHKIGCTTRVMQEFLRIPNPCAGGVFETQVHPSPAQVRHTDFVRPGVECEMVVRLASDLPQQGAPFNRHSVAAAVGAIMAGIEIVDDRYVDYKKLDTPMLIADDFFDAGCVLGEPASDWRALDLPALSGATWINGVEVGRGRGADVMGHPFEALAWLANSLARRGRGLRTGEFVFTGSVVETKWVQPGDKVVMTIDGLGTVEAVFE